MKANNYFGVRRYGADLGIRRRRRKHFRPSTKQGRAGVDSIQRPAGFVDGYFYQERRTLAMRSQPGNTGCGATEIADFI